jgi:hypothetical protein
LAFLSSFKKGGIRDDKSNSSASIEGSSVGNLLSEYSQPLPDAEEFKATMPQNIHNLPYVMDVNAATLQVSKQESSLTNSSNLAS